MVFSGRGTIPLSHEVTKAGANAFVEKEAGAQQLIDVTTQFFNPGHGLVAGEALVLEDAKGDDQVLTDGILFRGIEFRPKVDQGGRAPALELANAAHAVAAGALLGAFLLVAGGGFFLLLAIRAAGHGLPKLLLEDLGVEGGVGEIDPIQVLVQE